MSLVDTGEKKVDLQEFKDRKTLQTILQFLINHTNTWNVYRHGWKSNI